MKGRSDKTLAALRAIANGETLYRAAINNGMAHSHLHLVWSIERARGLKATTLPRELWKALNKRYPGKA